jgi:hypothetical protein
MKKDSPKKGKYCYEQREFDFRNGTYLVRFLNSIPNLEVVRFKLSEEECEVVG